MSAMVRLLGALLSRPASLAVILGTALGYALLYLWLVGDIAGGGRGGLRLAFPAWERAFESRGALRFEPVGLIELGPWVWTFSPLDTLIALGLGGLLGANLAGLWRLRRAARQCPVKPPSGALLAGLPALLAGGACCAPLLVIWLGLPIAGSLAVLAPWLVPLSCLALLLGLWRLAVWQSPGEARKEGD
ncbi:hypothetical protein ACFPTY_12905 [Halomonas beimenensis]|uniref:Uncharacterized protein n=1 Tax=Halomonas beimenensis TaxID=475662 RepID=A0A291PAN8_9GAMM|nr:hypothetical protein [Halomonas beimenensis]ATJ83922.1 hypothetical protein BEI_2935 [Halomonas beimenensis]